MTELEAYEKAVEKWTGIADALKEAKTVEIKFSGILIVDSKSVASFGPDDCAYCVLADSDDSFVCPLSGTGRCDSCERTSYYDVVNACRKGDADMAFYYATELRDQIIANKPNIT